MSDKQGRGVVARILAPPDARWVFLTSYLQTHATRVPPQGSSVATHANRLQPAG